MSFRFRTHGTSARPSDGQYLSCQVGAGDLEWTAGYGGSKPCHIARLGRAALAGVLSIRIRDADPDTPRPGSSACRRSKGLIPVRSSAVPEEEPERRLRQPASTISAFVCAISIRRKSSKPLVSYGLELRESECRRACGTAQYIRQHADAGSRRSAGRNARTVLHRS